MKIRTSFVSNSSTSSFIIVGFRVPQDQLSKFPDEQLEGLEVYNDYYPPLVGREVFCNENGGLLDVGLLNGTIEELKARYGDQLGNPIVYVDAYTDS
jgi:hypothetical protein